MDVNNLITKILFDGKETFIITKDKSVIQRLSLDLKGKPSSDGSMAFNVSFCNLLIITEHKQTKQGLYFQMNIETAKEKTTQPDKPIEKKPEPKTTKAPEVVKHIQKAVDILQKNNVKVIPNMPVKQTEKANSATKTESIHHKPEQVKSVLTRFKKQPEEKDLW